MEYYTIDFVYGAQHLDRIQVTRVPNTGEHVILHDPDNNDCIIEYCIESITTDYTARYIIINVKPVKY